MDQRPLFLMTDPGHYDVCYPINPWMQRYIFPGAYLPTLSELAPALEGQGFWLTDLENWRLHYAKTLAAWNGRFQARKEGLARTTAIEMLFQFLT